MQGLIPKHFERPDDVIVGAVVGVLPDFVYQVRPVGIIIQYIHRFFGAGQSTGFIKVNSCENPEECAVRGLNKIVSDEKYKHLGFSMKSKIYK